MGEVEVGDRLAVTELDPSPFIEDFPHELGAIDSIVGPLEIQVVVLADETLDRIGKQLLFFVVIEIHGVLLTVPATSWR
ncbi:hypothetical protein D3C83_83100 [compost metagenome]